MPKPRRFDEQLIDDITFAQQGLVTYGQLRDAGVSSATISHRTRTGGPWQRLLPGIYLVTQAAPTLVQRRRAALLYAGDPSLLTGVVGLAIHGLRYLPADPETALVHVLIPHERRRTSVGLALVERTRRFPDGPDPRLGPVAPIARCLFDASRRYNHVRNTRAMILEAVQRGLVDNAELASEVGDGQRRWTAILRRVVNDAGAGVASAPEAEFRDLVVRSGLDEPLWNASLYTPNGTFVARPDGYLPDLGLAVQVDSREHHSRGDKWDDTLRRISRMTATGVAVWSLVVSDLRANPRDVLREYQAACRARANVPMPKLVVVKSNGTQWVPEPR
jgi:hypothetical protein